MAHPRLTLIAEAQKLDRAAADTARIRQRYLAHQPKAALYVDFPDFAFWRLTVVSASLNGGFGRAYRMGAGDVLLAAEKIAEFAELEVDAIAHMNADHAEAVNLYATRLCGGAPGNWIMTSLDPEGAVLASGDTLLRLRFPRLLTQAAELRPMLVTLAKAARQQTG